MSCEHIKNFKVAKPTQTYACEECVKKGDKWVHLRTCQICGSTLCCDSSPNQHMTKHYHESGHAIVISAEPKENWVWCYIDEVMVQY